MDLVQVTKKKKFNIKDYLGIIQTISKVEYHNIAYNYLIEYDELVNIGIQVVDHLSKKCDMEKINNAYITTAIKWAIRNEVRRRCRWYTSKLNKSERSSLFCHEDEKGELVLREALYKTILSIDEMQENDNPTIIADKTHNPEEALVFSEIAIIIKEAISTLTQREKEIIESRFYENKKLRVISEEFNISQSRVSRILQIALNKMKAELLNKNIL